MAMAILSGEASPGQFRFASRFCPARVAWRFCWGRAARIKFPHLLHIPTDLWDLGIFISCFVTERMHKDLKLAVLFVYRNVEHTTTANWANWYMQECISGRSKFQRNIMKIPILRHAPDGTPFYFAREMVMHIILTGHVGDIAMVSLDDRSTFCVGRISGFYFVSLSKADLNDAYVEVELFSAFSDDWCEWETDSPSSVVLPVIRLAQLLTYMKRRKGVIRIALPSA